MQKVKKKKLKIRKTLCQFYPLFSNQMQVEVIFWEIILSPETKLWGNLLLHCHCDNSQIQSKCKSPLDVTIGLYLCSSSRNLSQHHKEIKSSIKIFRELFWKNSPGSYGITIFLLVLFRILEEQTHWTWSTIKTLWVVIWKSLCFNREIYNNQQSKSGHDSMTYKYY